HSKQIVLNEGKRLRPYLAYLMYCAMGGKDIEKALKFFTALEIVHSYALIHDDVIDRASTRHGVATVHKYISENLSKEKRLGDLNHIGNSQAILLGDFLFSLSAEIFSLNTDFELDNIQTARKYFYKMVDEVILGQMLDVDVTTKEVVSEKTIEEKTRLKTSRYSCVRPMQIGASLANPNFSLEDFCENLGTKVGIAFQMQDDLLDIIGDEKITHKSALNDIAERQHTFFTNFVFSKGSGEQIGYLKSVFGKKVTEENKDKIRNLFIDSGAVDAGKNVISQNLKMAKEIIENSSLKTEYKESFLMLIQILEQRQG
ncbi:MAG: polyprenyl synthetase family protein, partial [Patescibacteria group bacterium]|nr:polyprenyl synthetase family protein [Patescibacteria group bacterium]